LLVSSGRAWMAIIDPIGRSANPSWPRHKPA